VTMAPQWDQHNVTDLIRDILRSVPPDPKYGTGRPFMTTHQLAIEFANRYPQVASALGHPTGGQGQGPFALTTYIARWLPQRIGTPGAGDIELAFLAPLHLTTLKFDSNGTPLTATTNQAGYNSTMFRLIDGQPLSSRGHTE
jgi:hypothetical protein